MSGGTVTTKPPNTLYIHFPFFLKTVTLKVSPELTSSTGSRSGG